MSGESFALPPGTTIAHYRIEEAIGAGGMGEVYRAFDLTLERSVALKVLPPDLLHDVDRVRRFVQEAKSASALNHPNIVTIYEIGQTTIKLEAREAAVHYIAMEFIDGVTLRAKIYKGGTRAELLDALAQAADGLGKAHAAGIVHRDLKPDNIMVTRDGFAKIVDFGLAKLTEKKQNSDVKTTQAGMIMGTIGYMSPEQVQGKQLDYRSDIFSFGCIIYEAVTKRRPFESDMAVDTLHKIIFAQPPAMTELAPDVPLQLQEVVAETLRKNVAERTITTRDIAKKLREIAPITESAEVRIQEFEKTVTLPSPAAGVAQPPVVSHAPNVSATRYRPRRTVASYLSAAYKLAIVAAVAVVGYGWATLPDVSALAEGKPPGLSSWVSYGETSSSLRRAAVAAADKQFYEQKPVKLADLKKPSASMISSGAYRFYPSEITLAAANSIYASSANPLKKVTAIAAAYAMEQKLSRRRILELYLNTRSFGEAVGVAAASKKYFDAKPSSLSPKQATLLVAAAHAGAESFSAEKPSPALVALQAQLLDALASSTGSEAK